MKKFPIEPLCPFTTIGFVCAIDKNLPFFVLGSFLLVLFKTINNKALSHTHTHLGIHKKNHSPIHSHTRTHRKKTIVILNRFFTRITLWVRLPHYFSIIGEWLSFTAESIRLSKMVKPIEAKVELSHIMKRKLAKSREFCGYKHTNRKRTRDEIYFGRVYVWVLVEHKTLIHT